MDNEHLQPFPEQSEFIPEIYQYCDRWCERCPLTARCMNFVLNRDHFSEFGLFDAHSLAFWQSLLDAFRAMREFLEEALKRSGLEITEADLIAAKAREQAKQRQLETHDCSQAARRYIALVDDWFKAMADDLEAWADEWNAEEAAEATNQDRLTRLEEMQRFIETIRRYQRQIYAKLMRALSGKYDERQGVFLDETPKDGNGSAKVALIEIDRSILAWMALRDELPERQDDIIDFLVALARLRTHVEQIFPDARAFIRPGFDEIAAA